MSSGGGVVAGAVGVIAFGVACTGTSLAAWMGRWPWRSPPRGRAELILAVLPGGLGAIVLGAAMLLPRGRLEDQVSAALFVTGLALMLTYLVATWTMPRWFRSRWYMNWMKRHDPERKRQGGASP
jgi:hypothetical protein